MTGGGPGGPARMWRSSTLWLPFLLTLPVSGLFVLYILLVEGLNSGNCFDVCGGPTGLPDWAVSAAFGR